MGKKAEKKRLNNSRIKSKTFLAFDEDARKEWLTTFSKRKKERQAQAKHDLEEMLKDEKVRQRQEFRETIKKKEKKYLEHIRDVEEILREKTLAYKCGEKTVEITEYNFDEQDDMIGTNKQEDELEEGSDKKTGDVVKVVIKEDEAEEGEDDDNESEEDDDEISNRLATDKKMPRKMSRAAVKIEKKLHKLNNKRKITKHAMNKKKQLAAEKAANRKGKPAAKLKSGKKKR